MRLGWFGDRYELYNSILKAMRVLAFRLHPHQDLRQRLQAIAVHHGIEAGFILSGIGSLRRASLRFADHPQPEHLEGPFEVISLNGTLSLHGLHIHMAIADPKGHIIGGHLCDGSIIYTTAEIIIGIADSQVFGRAIDNHTGFLELSIQHPNDQG